MTGGKFASAAGEFVTSPRKHRPVQRHAFQESAPQRQKGAASPGRLGYLVYLVLAISLASNSLWVLFNSTQSAGAYLEESAGQLLGSSTRERTPVSVSSSVASASAPSPDGPSEDELSADELSKLLLGPGDCGGTGLQELRKVLRNVVIIFNFEEDSAARNASAFLHSVYGRLFGAIVVLGPTDAPHERVTGRVSHRWGNLSGSGLEEELRRKALSNPNIGPWSFTAGAFSYLSFPKVVAMHPNAEGYFWAEDGVVVNYWQLIRGDKSKLWLTDMPECQRCQGFVPFDHRILPTVFDGWSGHKEVRARARNAFYQLKDRYKQQFLKSSEPFMNVTSFPKRMVDAFYVPQRLAFDLAFDLIPHFRQFGVVAELALPTMFYALDYPHNFDAILHRADHRMEPDSYRYDAAAVWTPYLAVFYHWALHSGSERAKLLQAFSIADTCLLRLLPTLNATDVRADIQ